MMGNNEIRITCCRNILAFFNLSAFKRSFSDFDGVCSVALQRQWIRERVNNTRTSKFRNKPGGLEWLTLFVRSNIGDRITFNHFRLFFHFLFFLFLGYCGLDNRVSLCFLYILGLQQRLPKKKKNKMKDRAKIYYIQNHDQVSTCSMGSSHSKDEENQIYHLIFLAPSQPMRQLVR
jgi:hypothetical protein